MNKERNSTIQKKSKAFLLVFLIVGIFTLQAQNNIDVQVSGVFNSLVSAYGSTKSAPQLIVTSGKTLQQTPAFYTTTPKPSIKVDARFYKLCQTFGKDSLNALSIVLSHELAHYYNDHTFCSDFAFAVSKENKLLASKLKLVSRTEKMSLETQADHKGLFYAAIAGYAPFEIQPQLLDAIYQTYQLKEENLGYPSKSERKEIAKTAQEKAATLYLVFKKGLQALEENQYDLAIAFFEEINQHFPSRENYNNMGVAKTLKALDLKVLSSEEYNYPRRFLYPLEIDNTSRLNQSATRGNGGSQEQMMVLLKSAQKDFEKAISLDISYSKSYINIASVFDLLDNPEAAIGKIKELPIEKQKETEAQRILAIAYYHADNEKKAEEIWEELNMHKK